MDVVDILVLLCSQVVSKHVTKLDLSECDVSNDALTTISTSCPFLRTIDLNAAKTSRTAVSSQGLYSYFAYYFCEFFVSFAAVCMSADDPWIHCGRKVADMG